MRMTDKKLRPAATTGRNRPGGRLTVPTSPPRYDALSDDDLVKRALAGNTGAFEALWSRHEQRCRVVVRRIVRSDADIEDALAQTRLTLLTRAAGYVHGTQFQAWLRRVAWTNALNVAKANRRSPMPASDGNGDRLDWLIDQASEVSQQVNEELHDRGSRLRGLINDLPKHLAAVVWMRAVGGSCGDIASVLGIPAGTVKSRLHAARMALVELERDRGSAGEV